MIDHAKHMMRTVRVIAVAVALLALLSAPALARKPGAGDPGVGLAQKLFLSASAVMDSCGAAFDAEPTTVFICAHSDMRDSVIRAAIDMELLDVALDDQSAWARSADGMVSRGVWFDGTLYLVAILNGDVALAWKPGQE